MRRLAPPWSRLAAAVRARVARACWIAMKIPSTGARNRCGAAHAPRRAASVARRSSNPCPVDGGALRSKPPVATGLNDLQVPPPGAFCQTHPDQPRPRRWTVGAADLAWRDAGSGASGRLTAARERVGGFGRTTDGGISIAFHPHRRRSCNGHDRAQTARARPGGATTARMSQRAAAHRSSAARTTKGTHERSGRRSSAWRFRAGAGTCARQPRGRAAGGPPWPGPRA